MRIRQRSSYFVIVIYFTIPEPLRYLTDYIDSVYRSVESLNERVFGDP